MPAAWARSTAQPSDGHPAIHPQGDSLLQALVPRVAQRTFSLLGKCGQILIELPYFVPAFLKLRVSCLGWLAGCLPLSS